MNQIIFSLPGNEKLAAGIAENLRLEKGNLIIREFPDGETYVRLLSDVKDKTCVVVCALHHPNEKFLPLYFLSKLLKDSGAGKVTIVTPYLGYMRQDKQFNPGEAVTSEYFASIVSQFIDGLITIDPHLHRRLSMSEIYSIPCKVLHASGLISKWIKENVMYPLLIGPDSESEQWVSEVAREANAPHIVLEKTRRGDRDVEVSVPEVKRYRDRTPVLVDDIISTARTMIQAVKHLNDTGMKAPVCIGVHPVFAPNAYEDLIIAGVEKVVSCNTITHESNGIDISFLLSEALKTKVP